MKGHVGDATRLVGRPPEILTILAEAARYDRIAGIDKGRRTIRDLEARVVRGRLETRADAPG
jgi:hypothetical protein